MRGFEKKLRGTEKKACKPELSAEADRLGLPRCPKCNAPLLSGFGDSSGDYHTCPSLQSCDTDGFREWK